MLVRPFTRNSVSRGIQTTLLTAFFRTARAHIIHLNKVAEDWLVSGGNPFGVYLYTQKIDALAASLGDLLLQKPEHKPWGMYEFALSDPDETLVRVGWPSDPHTRIAANISAH